LFKKLIKKNFNIKNLFNFFIFLKENFKKTKKIKYPVIFYKIFLFFSIFKFYFINFNIFFYMLYKNILLNKKKTKLKIKAKNKIKSIYKYIFKNISFFYNKKINFNVFYNNYIINNNKLNRYNLNTFIFKNFSDIYNNQYPLLILSNNKKILNKFNLKKNFFFLSLFNIFILNFFESFFKLNFFLKINNKLPVYNSYQILNFFNRGNNFFKNYKFFNFLEMVEILLISFLNKDLIFFKNWLKIMLDEMNIKNHKKFFVILSDFISDNFIYFFNNFKILGFYFFVRGKIGLSGNAKKKRFSFKKGLINISSKKSKIDFQKFNIKTNCGSLGISIIMSY